MNIYMLCISTSVCMLAHAFTWWKTIKNIRKWWKKYLCIMHRRSSRKAHEEKQRKKFVGQSLGVTPKSWLTPKRMMKKVLFSSFSNVFCCFRPCKRMLKHGFAGRNTQHIYNFFLIPGKSYVDLECFPWSLISNFEIKI